MHSVHRSTVFGEAASATGKGGISPKSFLSSISEKVGASLFLFSLFFILYSIFFFFLFSSHFHLSQYMGDIL